VLIDQGGLVLSVNACLYERQATRLSFTGYRTTKQRLQAPDASAEWLEGRQPAEDRHSYLWSTSLSMELSSAPCLSPTNIEELKNGYPPFRKELHYRQRRTPATVPF